MGLFLVTIGEFMGLLKNYDELLKYGFVGFLYLVSLGWMTQFTIQWVKQILTGTSGGILKRDIRWLLMKVTVIIYPAVIFIVRVVKVLIEVSGGILMYMLYGDEEKWL